MLKKLSKKPEVAEKSRQQGRPKSEVTRELRLPVRFSEAEIEQVRVAAQEEECSVSAWVRRRLGLAGTGYGE